MTEKPITLSPRQAHLLAITQIFGEYQLGPGEGPVANALVRKGLVERLPFPAANFIKIKREWRLVTTEEKTA
jgi:hypothetical protein